MRLQHIRFSGLFSGVFCLVMAGCIPNSSPDKTPSETLSINPSSASENVQVEVRWTYKDDYRFAVEISIENYPVPQGFQTRCPLTQLEVKKERKTLLLYRNPEQITLDEFYTLSQKSNWYCSSQRTGHGSVDYVFSLSYFYTTNESVFDFSEDCVLSLELGEVFATNSTSAITLPGLGIFQLPIEIKDGEKRLTWLSSIKITDKGITVQIERVAVSPSFTLLDTCLEYQDHHFWSPRARLVYQDLSAYSTEWLPTYPYPFDRDTTLGSTRRCYTFIIPLIFPFDSLSSFHIGIDQVQIINDAGTIKRAECEAIKSSMEKLYPGLQIECNTFEIHGETQNWFQIHSSPDSFSEEEAYKLVESAFQQSFTGPWEIEIELQERKPFERTRSHPTPEER